MYKKRFKISCVLSDKSMLFINGSTTDTVLKEMTNSEIFRQLRFYIIISYEDERTGNMLKATPITERFTKPIKPILIEKIFSKIG